MPREDFSKPLPLDQVRLDPEIQPRVAIDSDLVAEYRAVLDEGAIFDDVTVFHDGSVYWVADGFHRVLAYRMAGRATIPGHVYQGGKREATLHAVGANAEHGLRRTNADKRRAVEILLRDAEWSQLSDREIARLARVDKKTASSIRRALSGEIPQIDSKRTVTRKGTTYTQDTSRIGSRPKPEPPPLAQDEPEPGPDEPDEPEPDEDVEPEPEDEADGDVEPEPEQPASPGFTQYEIPKFFQLNHKIARFLNSLRRRGGILGLLAGADSRAIQSVHTHLTSLRELCNQCARDLEREHPWLTSRNRNG